MKKELIKKLVEELKSEGSRGGKVIGHTKSGKAIYEKHEQSHTQHYTAEDHSDAMSAHMKAAKDHQHKSDFNNKVHKDLQSTQSEDKNRRDDEMQEAWDSKHKHERQSKHHSQMAELHSKAMNSKLDKKSEKKD